MDPFWHIKQAHRENEDVRSDLSHLVHPRVGLQGEQPWYLLRWVLLLFFPGNFIFDYLRVCAPSIYGCLLFSTRELYLYSVEITVQVGECTHSNKVL